MQILTKHGTVVRVENESILALIQKLESDYKICLEKDLDTKEELQKQKDFTNNFSALQEFLEKVEAPEEIKNSIDEILAMLKSWDVYAFWFKEMKKLTAKCKDFFANFKTFAEAKGILPKPKAGSTKAKTPEKPVPPGIPATQKPSPGGKSAPQKPTPPGMPSLLKPIQRGAAPVQGISMSKTPSASGKAKPEPVSEEEPASAAETQGRKVPVLKPVFKHPPVKVPATAQPGSPERVAQKSIEEGPVDEQAAPVPLKALVDNKKLEIKVKPVKLIKPIVAVKHEESPVMDEDTMPGFNAEPAEAMPAKPAKPALPMPVVEKKPIPPKVPAKAKPSTKPAPSPASKLASDEGLARPAPAKQPPAKSKSEKPLLIPKPIKIVVPDLGNIDIEEEITPARSGGEPHGSPKGKTLEERPGEGEISSTEQEVKLPPRHVKPIAVNVKVDRKPAVTMAYDNDDIVEQVADKVTKRLNPEPKQIVVKFQSPDGEYITPAAIKPEDIAELGLDETVEPKKGTSTKASPDLVTKLENAADWDDETISEILDAKESEPTIISSTSSPQKNEAPVGNQKSKANAADMITSAFKTFAPPLTDKKGADKKGAEKKGADKKGAEKKGADKKGADKKAASKENLGLDVIDQEPQKTRLQDIKKPAPAASEMAGEASDAMSLFTGALQSKTKDGGKKAAASSGLMPMFSKNEAEPAAKPSKTAKTQAPIGADVDVDSLPETKDGLYQALIALEAKRYAIERAKKDLQSDLDKGIIKSSDYENKVASLKGEMDKIGERIKGIREKTKKFK